MPPVCYQEPYLRPLTWDCKVTLAWCQQSTETGTSQFQMSRSTLQENHAQLVWICFILWPVCKGWMRCSTSLSIPRLGIENLNARWGQAAGRLGEETWMGPEHLGAWLKGAATVQPQFEGQLGSCAARSVVLHRGAANPEVISLQPLIW